MDDLDAIERLAALRDRGALTDSEFAEQKATILAESSTGGPSAVSAAGGFNWRAAIALAAVLALVWIAVAVRPSGSAGPAAAATTRAATPVPFRADQVILPPEQFPVTGYVVRLDQAAPNDGWQRIFGLPNREDGAVAVAVTPIGPDVVDPRGFFAALAQHACVASGNALLARDSGPTSLSIADVDRMCIYGYASGPATLALRALVGRYVVEVITNGSPSMDATEQANETVAVMRTQVGIIRRLSR